MATLWECANLSVCRHTIRTAQREEKKSHHKPTYQRCNITFMNVRDNEIVGKYTLQINFKVYVEDSN